MNDRYLYRAKRMDDGEWVGGGYSYCVKDDTHFITQMSKDHISYIGRHQQVDPNTICQCTGLKDKNGKLIWENDIAKQFADCDELGNTLYFFYRIKWNNEYSAFEGYEIYTKETVLFPDLEDIEVIGNIFDNPELLEVGHE